MTYHYWFMFRVAMVGDEKKRRQSIYEAIEAQKPNAYRWYETTSSGLIESELTAAYLVQRITRGLNSAVDMLVAADLHNPEDAAFFGAEEHPDVLKFFLPKAVKVT